MKSGSCDTIGVEFLSSVHGALGLSLRTTLKMGLRGGEVYSLGDICTGL